VRVVLGRQSSAVHLLMPPRPPLPHAAKQAAQSIQTSRKLTDAPGTQVQQHAYIHMHACVSACLEQDDQIKTAAIFFVIKANKGGKDQRSWWELKGKRRKKFVENGRRSLAGTDVMVGTWGGRWRR